MKKKKITWKIKIRSAVLFGIIALIVTFPFTWQELKGDTPKEIKKVEKNLRDLFGEQLSDSKRRLPPWGKVEEITNSLIFKNRRIAQAKALLRYNENLFSDIIFTESNKELWENRYQLSKQKWQIQTITSKTLISLGISIASGIATILSVFLILTLVPWLWYFILERIGELSQSVQGKSDS